MNELVDYAKQFIGIPYRWGGNNPLQGFDCSGFVQWVFQSIGVDPKGDQTASDLFKYFRDNGHATDKPEAGTLVFYGKSPNHVTHVAMAIDGFRVIEAGGGNRTTTSVKKATEQGACVRERPYNYRRDIVALVKPRFPSI